MVTATAVIDPATLALIRQSQNAAPPPAMDVPQMGTASLPQMAPPTMPNVQPLPVVPVPPTQAQSDISKLDYLRNSGSGISQIGNDVDAQGNKTSNNPGFWKTLGKVGATVGDDLLKIAAPNIERNLPGTEGNNLRLQGIQQGQVANDLATQKTQGDLAQQQAQLGLTGAQTAYAAARPDIEQSKIDQKQTAVQERVGQAAAARGQLVSWDENGIPTFTDDHNSQAYADHQALSAMHDATAEKSKIQSDIAKNHYIPGTPEFTEAQRKLAQVDQRMQIAMGSLGLRSQGLQLRRESQAAQNTGIDPTTGQPFAGATQIADGNGGKTTVGSRFAGHAITQTGAVGTFNDLVGSTSHLRNAIEAYEAEGGDMSDPTLAAAAADPHSVVGKVIQGKLVTGGLSPSALTLLNAQRQTMEQAGILRKLTPTGSGAEAAAQRILATVPVFGSDTNDSARSKLDEQEEVLQRLKLAVPTVAGGQSVKLRTSNSAASSAIPPAAAAQLQEGVIHTFGNGQQWTKTNGVPTRVK